jgi:hypothetical protein
LKLLTLLILSLLSQLFGRVSSQGGRRTPSPRPPEVKPEQFWRLLTRNQVWRWADDMFRLLNANK